MGSTTEYAALLRGQRGRWLPSPSRETKQDEGCSLKRNHLQSTPQFAVLAQADLGFAIGPVFVSHGAQNCRQLRLHEAEFAERGCMNLCLLNLVR